MNGVRLQFWQVTANNTAQKSKACLQGPNIPTPPDHINDEFLCWKNTQCAYPKFNTIRSQDVDWLHLGCRYFAVKNGMFDFVDCSRLLTAAVLPRSQRI